MDSSAYSKLFLREAGTEALRSFLHAVPSAVRAASLLVRVEVRSAFERKLRLGEISEIELHRSLIQLTDSFGFVVLIDLSTANVELAARLVGTRGLRTLDALQLASALALRIELLPGDTLLFIGSDHRLLAAAVAEGLTTWDPADSTQPPPIL